MSSETEKSGNERFSEKEKGILYQTGDWFLYVTEGDVLYVFDEGREHVLEFSKRSNGWFRSANGSVEVVHFVTGVTKRQVMKGRKEVLDKVMSEEEEKKKKIFELSGKCCGSFGGVTVNVDGEKGQMKVSWSGEWDIELPLKCEDKEKLTFKDFSLFGETTVDDVMDAFNRASEIAAEKEAKEKERMEKEKAEEAERLKKLLGGEPNEEACKAFCSLEKMTVFSYGIWFMVIPSDEDLLFVSTVDGSHVVRISFGSNGWFNTKGTNGGHMHWSSGDTNDEEMGTSEGLEYLQDHIEEGAGNRLRPGLEVNHNEWNISLKEDGIHIRRDYDIFLALDDIRGTHRDLELEF